MRNPDKLAVELMKKVNPLTNEEKMEYVNIYSIENGVKNRVYKITPDRERYQVAVAYNGETSNFHIAARLNDILKMLDDLFSNGQVMTRKGPIPTKNCITRDITALEAKAIVRFERNAFTRENVPKPLRETKPNLINNHMDFGDYLLQVIPRGKKCFYAYRTFNRTTDRWLQKTIRQ